MALKCRSRKRWRENRVRHCGSRTLSTIVLCGSWKKAVSSTKFIILGKLPAEMPIVMAELLCCKEILLNPPSPKGEIFQKTLRLFEKARPESVDCAHDRLSGRKYAEEV